MMMTVYFYCFACSPNDDDDGMDDEMAQAYEEFLKMKDQGK